MKAIIFDCDGTLYCKNNLLLNLIDKRTDDFLYRHTVEDTKMLEKSIPNILEALNCLSLKRDEFISFVYDGLKYEKYLNDDQELKKLLIQIAYSKFVVSLSPRKHLNLVMKQLDIISLFTEVFSICDTTHLTEKKNIYISILEQYKLKAKDVICVGDSYDVDLIQAQQLGMTAFLINQGLDHHDDKGGIKIFNDIKICLKYIINL